MKVAIVHDWLNQAGGAERVVASLHGLYPTAPIFTTICNRESLWGDLKDADIRVSWMQRLPGVKRHFKKYLPLYAMAIESLPLADYDLVVSSSSAFAKGARRGPEAMHICYCHTPMRFVWQHAEYMGREGYSRWSAAAVSPFIRRLKRWDLATADRPDLYLACSQTTAGRIKACYGRDSQVIHPPVDVARHSPDEASEDYYLCVSRLNGYKRIDLLVDAFNGLDRRLRIVGDGPQLSALRWRAGSNVELLGRLPDPEVTDLYARCRAFILPGLEDFGITPLEANAAGKPVIAFRGGGASETVIEGRTGVFFDRQEPPCLREAIRSCEEARWDRAAIRAHAESFAEPVFRQRFKAAVDQFLGEQGGVRQ